MWKRTAVMFCGVTAFLARADTNYYKRVFFDNSTSVGSYFYSEGKPSAPSQLELIDGKLPVDTDHFRTPPNALRLRWTTLRDGGWDAEIKLYEWRNRDIHFPGEYLGFWCFAPEAIAPDNLPRLSLRDHQKGFTHPLPIGSVARGISAGTWTHVRIPLSSFVSASLRPFEPHQVVGLIFLQSAADGRQHTLVVDDIHIEPAEEPKAPPAPIAVRNIRARGFERHVDVSWEPQGSAEAPAYYVVYRAAGNENFRAVGIQVPGIHRFADYLGKPPQRARYRVTAADWSGRESNPSEAVEAATRPMGDEDLLTMVEEASFRYYWEAGAHPASGMIRENIPGDDEIVATGATGFGVMALIVGAERAFVPRAQVVHRLLRIANFLEKADRYHGVWPHFTNGKTGKRIPVFGVYENGADLVEMSFLMQGLLAARAYFNRDTSDENALRNAITSLWNSIDWRWFRRTPDGDALFWHWSPEYTWHINHRLTGYNETMITYLLAIASQSHGVPPDLYYTGWAGQSEAAIAYRQSWGQTTPGDHYTNGGRYEGIKLDVGVREGGPLFFAHYSYMGFDPHARDRYTNYFENSRNMALINRAYCIRNPRHYRGYSAQCWGITAVDGPEGYSAYEPKPLADDGTIAPTGAAASYPYTPEASLAAIKYFYRDLGDRLWDVYGFRDALNLQKNWYSGIYMGLNQAPMTVMIENGRTGLVWKTFMANPEIQSMMERVKFKVER